MAIADVIVIMNRGRIEDAGPPQRLYERPRTRFAARFLGESSLVEGSVCAGGGGRLMVDTPCGRLEVAGERGVDSRVTLAIRPEAVRIGAAQGGDQALGDLDVEEIVFQGSFARVSGRLAGGVRLLAKVAPHCLAPGAVRVPVAVQAGGLVLLED